MIADSSSHLPATELQRWAEADKRQVISLIRALVATPSRGGIDPYGPVIDLVATWLDDHELPVRLINDATTGQPVGIACDVPGAQPGPRYVLDSCVDTAPFGDPASWRHPPTSAAVEDGWLYGRGAADSKAAIAIFLHIAARLRQQTARLYGTLTLLFDADEHTGRFGGAKNYFGGTDAPSDVAGVMIGYPGADELVVGGRGFLRAEMIIKGRAGHTGSRRPANDNAVEKAAELVRVLAENREPGPVDPILELSPKLTVTGIGGGESYSTVPDHCIVKADVRLTTDFDEAAARDLIRQATTQIDNRWPASEQTTIVFHESWPAYRLSESAPIRAELLRAAQRHMPNPVTAKVAGPSNIGNYLASLGIDATAGLGVRYEGLHGTDERIELGTVPAVQATYHDALLRLLTRPE